MATVQVNLFASITCQELQILLEQSCTADMPLLIATSTFGLGRKRLTSPQWCYLHCLCIIQLQKKACYITN